MLVLVVPPFANPPHLPTPSNAAEYSYITGLVSGILCVGVTSIFRSFLAVLDRPISCSGLFLIIQLST